MLSRIQMYVMDIAILVRDTEHWIYHHHSTNCSEEKICVERIKYLGQNTPNIDL